MAERGAGLSCSPFPNNSPARPALGKGQIVKAHLERAVAYVRTPQLAVEDFSGLLEDFEHWFEVVRVDGPLSRYGYKLKSNSDELAVDDLSSRVELFYLAVSFSKKKSRICSPQWM